MASDRRQATDDAIRATLESFPAPSTWHEIEAATKRLLAEVDRQTGNVAALLRLRSAERSLRKAKESRSFTKEYGDEEAYAKAARVVDEARAEWGDAFDAAVAMGLVEP